MSYTSKFPTLAEQIAGRCKHFTGMMNKTCAAGVLYDDVKEVPGVNIPCLLRHGGDAIDCAKREFPTPTEVAEEVEQEVEQIEKVFRDIQAAREAIVEKIGPYKCGVTHGVSGKIPCPVCGTGTLNYSRAGMNGHIHARCSTDGCVMWME